MTVTLSSLVAPAAANADERSNGFNVGGAILQEWIAVGRNGYAITPENDALNSGKWQAFSNRNSIYWNQATGAHQVGGLVRDRWEQLGWERGILGYPTTRELDTRKPGKFNRFQNGNVYWKSGSDRAYNVQGVILQKWGTLDYENGPLGFPIGNEVRLNKDGGATSLFEGGSIYWSAATGARVVWGAIRDNWASRGFETGRFGYPTTDEYNALNGKAQNFQGGTIDWRPGDVANPAEVPRPSGSRSFADYQVPGGVIDPRARTQGEVLPDGAVEPDSLPDPSGSEPAGPPTTVPLVTPTPTESAQELPPVVSDSPETTTPTASSDPSGRSQFFRASSQESPGETDPDGDTLPDYGCRVSVARPHLSESRANGVRQYPLQIHTQTKSTCQYGPPLSHSLETYTARLRWFGQRENLNQVPMRGKTIKPSGQVAINSRPLATLKLNSAVNCAEGTWFRYYTAATGSYTFPNGDTDTKTAWEENEQGKEVNCIQ